MNGTSSRDICDFPQWRMALEATGCGQAEPQLHHTLHLEIAVFVTPCAWHESFQRDNDKRNSAHTSHKWARNFICGPQTTPQLQHRGTPSWKTAGQITTCGRPGQTLMAPLRFASWSARHLSRCMRVYHDEDRLSSSILVALDSKTRHQSCGVSTPETRGNVATRNPRHQAPHQVHLCAPWHRRLLK
jgi:hypothetical protein